MVEGNKDMENYGTANRTFLIAMDGRMQSWVNDELLFERGLIH